MGLAAFFAGIHIQAGHFQITYYLIFLLAAIALGAGWRAMRQKSMPQFLRAGGMLALGAVIAALPQTSQLALTEQYSEYTTRGKSNLVVDSKEETRDGLDRSYILEYSMSRSEWLSIFVPDIKGGNNQLYWGEQTFSAGAIYFGAIAFSLWMAWMIAGSSWLRWPTFLVSVMAVMLSWRSASGLTNLFLDHMPLFDKFRDTKMMLVLLQVISRWVRRWRCTK